MSRICYIAFFFFRALSNSVCTELNSSEHGSPLHHRDSTLKRDVIFFDSNRRRLKKSGKSDCKPILAKETKSHKSKKESKSPKSDKGKKGKCDESRRPSISPEVSPSSSNTEPTTIAPQKPNVYDCASFTGRKHDILATVSSVSGTFLEGTPQQRAYEWLLNSDLTTNSCKDDGMGIEYRYALAVFYFSTNGENWSKNRHWLSSSDHCSGWYGLSCNTRNEIITISLDQNNVGGIIPPEIAVFSSLVSFEVYNNSVSGTIPAQLYNLNEIKKLDLGYNNFEGPLFTNDLINASDTLQILRTSSNDLTGSIPVNLQRMTDLRELWFASNNISGSIPDEISSLTKLRSIFAYDNNLIGTIPHNLGRLSKIEMIDISDNEIHGNIPATIGELKKLRKLVVKNMKLDGSLPESMGKLKNLEMLFASLNSLTGSIPSNFSSLSNIRHLALNNNDFSGPLPYLNTGNLQLIDVSTNQITGSIPEHLLSSDALEFAYFSNNRLSGKIPRKYITQNLKDLWLDNNDLTGTIPDVPLVDFYAITEILLHRNKLDGPVPDDLCALRRLYPEQLTTLSVDCQPPTRFDVPFNSCRIDCCTECTTGKNRN